MRVREFLKEEEIIPFYVIHPDWEKSEKVAIRLTDMPNAHIFGEYWMDVSDEAQAEFGWDLPVHDEDQFGPIPKRRIKMSFDDYLTLVLNYAKSGKKGLVRGQK